MTESGSAGSEDTKLLVPRGTRRAGSLFEWPAVARAALVVSLPAPVFALSYARIGRLLQHPTEEPYLSRDALALLRTGFFAYVVATSVVVLLAWKLRRRAPDHRGFVVTTLLAFFLAIAFVTYLVGPFSTPVLGFFLAAATVVVLLFDWKTAFFTSFTGGLAIVLGVVLVYTKALPYGPFFRAPVFFLNDPPRTWLVTSAVLSLSLVAFPLTFILIVLERWRKHDEEVHHLARFDGLTDVANRRYFLELLGHEIARTQRFGSHVAFIILDLDHFKRVNDEHGHQTGDAVLARVASVLETDVVRRIDVVGRYGGEEFAMFLPETDLQGAIVVAERARRAIEETSFILENGQRLRVTASLGCAVFPHPGIDGIDALVRRADDALYRAKAEGRDRVSSVT